MADDLRSILIAHLPVAMVGTHGTDYLVEYAENQAPDEMGYGIVLDDITSMLQQRGYSRIQTDVDGGDVYECNCIGYTKADVDNFIAAVLKASILDPAELTFGFKGNDTYSQILPMVDNIERIGDQNWRNGKFAILCSKNNRDIF